MYTFLLSLHSILRWFVLAAGVAAVIFAFAGWFGRKEWTKRDNAIGAAFTGLFDLQVLIGLVLYGLVSPITQAAFSNFGGAMKDRVLRFWAVEHVFMMVIAVALVHVGRVLGKKAPDSVSRHKKTAIFFLIALLLTLAAIPWPGLATARPLFRLGA